MLNTYNYKEQNQGALLRAAIQGLSQKVDPNNEDYETYVKIIQEEIIELYKINFDGYMMLLADVAIVSREISGFVACFGSIQNSLTAFVLDIVEYFDIEQYDFKKFTPFVEKPLVNILISSYANDGCMGYVKHKYPDLIKKTKKRTIIFKDNLKIKFIDLGIELRVKEEEW